MNYQKENKEELKQNFVQTFLEVISTVATLLPHAFLKNSFLYQEMGHKRIPRIKIKTGIQNLTYRGYISKKPDGYLLTRKGKQWFQKSCRRYLSLRQKTWDKKWRIILFDIPSELQIKRHRFRHRLRMVNAYMIQKSVFVFPYPCEDEIAEWCNDLGLNEHVDIIQTDHIGSKEKYAKEFFDL